MIGQGEGTYEIAGVLNISTHTVESYYARIQQKLGLDGMYELRRHAIDHARQRADVTAGGAAPPRCVVVFRHTL